MTSTAQVVSDTAERASEETLAIVLSALENKRSFKLEAGAGAGKTYSLIQALKHILEKKASYLPRSDQRVACLTYTKLARDEIKARTDESPLIFTDTLHGFLWEMISPYQKALATSLRASEAWQEKLAENSDIDGLPIEYDLGIRSIGENRIALHHDDIPAFAIKLFGNKEFRSLVADRFPVIFIDEYQDTPVGLAEAVLSGNGEDRINPILGFFGDHWQQIYDHTCGSIDHPALTMIPKHANFRSDRTIVNFLNRLRPELPQAASGAAGEGTVTIYHTNSWPGVRLGRNWKGQISHEAARACVAWIRSSSPSKGWIKDSESLKVLMLTHATIANELGYPDLPKVFRYNDSFAKKEDPVVEYLVDTIEPALQAFGDNRYGDLFRILGSAKPTLSAPGDKIRWTDFFTSLKAATAERTVGDVLDMIGAEPFVSLPTRVMKRERELKEALASLAPGEELKEPRALKEHDAFRAVPYSEVRALGVYLSDDTVFSTKHSVKGAEFDDVVVLIGRGWAKYDFAKMLSAHAPHSSPELKEASSFEPSRNLFYVSASRAKHNLALLFVQELDDNALTTVTDWVGAENVIPIEFDDSGMPRL